MKPRGTRGPWDSMANRKGQAKLEGERPSCIFCGGRPVTAEHVLPKWLAGILQQGRGRFLGTVEYVRAGQPAQARPHVSRKELLAPVRIVCKDCNGGWMSQLQTDAKVLLEPMVLDQGRTWMASEDQALLARWAALTALLLGYSESPPRPAPPERLAWLRECEGAPPDRGYTSQRASQAGHWFARASTTTSSRTPRTCRSSPHCAALVCSCGA